MEFPVSRLNNFLVLGLLANKKYDLAKNDQSKKGYFFKLNYYDRLYFGRLFKKYRF